MNISRVVLFSLVDPGPGPTPGGPGPTRWRSHRRLPHSLAGFLGVAAVIAFGGCGEVGSTAQDPEPRSIEVPTPAEIVVSMDSDLIAGVADLQVGTDGHVYVVDRLEHAVKVFLPGNRLVRSWGREGQGPGEFLRPGPLRLFDDSVVVMDLGNRRIQTFSRDGRVLGTRPYPGVYGGDLRRDGLVVRPTLGVDSVLAVIHDPDGSERTAIGEVLAPPPGVVSLSEVRREVSEGGVPAIFLNTARVALGGNRDVWVVLPAAGRVERYGLDGERLLSMFLEEPEFEAARERFVAANEGAGPNEVFALEYFRAALPVGDRLWLLLDSGSHGPAVVLVISPNGEIERRVEFQGVRGAGDLAMDPGGGWIYFVLPDRAELVRVERPPELPIGS